MCADFLAPSVQVLAATYQRQNPNTIITVVQRADTLGYPLLLEGAVDIAVLTWLPDSRSDAIWLQVLALDGLAIIVHPQNGIPGLTQAQVQKLFQGQVENWEEWGGLPGVPQLMSRESASGEFLFMQNHLMREVRTSLNASLAPDTAIMEQYVSTNPLAVGYLSSSRLTPDVRAVAVDGVPPTSETIAAQIYPLTRAIYVVTDGEPVGAARGFVQWMLGNEGQSLLVSQDFIGHSE